MHCLHVLHLSVIFSKWFMELHTVLVIILFIMFVIIILVFSGMMIGAFDFSCQ